MLLHRTGHCGTSKKTLKMIDFFETTRLILSENTLLLRLWLQPDDSKAPPQPVLGYRPATPAQGIYP